MGVKHITAKYSFKAHTPVTGLFRTGPGKVPEEIAACWDP